MSRENHHNHNHKRTDGGACHKVRRLQGHRTAQWHKKTKETRVAATVMWIEASSERNRLEATLERRQRQRCPTVPHTD